MANKKSPTDIKSKLVRKPKANYPDRAFQEIDSDLEKGRLQGNILANMAEGVYLVRTDGIIVYANPKFEQMFGYNKEELIGKHVSIVNAPSEKSPEDTAREIMEELNRKGKWEGNVLNVKKDGTPFWCYAHVTTFEHSVYGTVWVCIHGDITPQMQKELEIEQSEKKFRNLMENVPLGISISTSEGKVIEANYTLWKIFGYDSKEEFLRIPAITHYYNQKDREQIVKLTIDGTLKNFETRFIRKDGSIFWGSVNSLRQTIDGSVTYLNTLMDISDRKLLEEEGDRLYQLEKLSRIDAEGAKYRFSFIAEASMLLTESLDIKKTLANVARFAVPRIADWCSVDLLREDNTLERVAVIHSDPAKIQLVYDLQRRYPPDGNDPNSPIKIIQRGEPFALWEIPEELIKKSARDEEHLKIIMALGLKSAIMVPLVYQDKKLGILSLVYAESDRIYGPADLELIKELALRASIAIENSSLYSQTVALNRELKVREARFRRIFESDMVGIIFWGRSGNILDANRAFLEIVQYSRDDVLTGKVRWADLTPPEFSILDEKSLQEMAERGVSTPFEKEYIRKDGRRVPVIIGSAVLEDANDQGVAFVLDITERKRMEECLRESEEKFRSVIQSAKDAIIASDESDKILSWNRGAREIFGYSEEEVIGKPITMLMPNQFRYDHTNGMNRLHSYVESMYIGKTFEAYGLRKDGVEFPVEIATSRWSVGNQIYFGAIVRDITQRKNAEKALHDSEKRYRETLNNMMEGCQIIDFGWHYTYLNEVAAEQGHVSKDAAIGHTMMEVFPRIDQTPMFGVLKKCMENRIPEQIENQFYYPDGNSRWFDLRIEPVPEGLFILSMDITERKVAEEIIKSLNSALEQKVIDRTSQLEAANKELEAFSYSVSHDLRAPLRSIDGYSQALLEDYPDKLDDQGKNYLERMRVNTQRMAQLIDDLLNLSRLSRSEMHIESVDLSSLAESVIINIKNAEPDRKVDVVIQPDLKTKGDSMLLGVVLTNLLSNAWKFTSRQAGAHIEIGSLEIAGERTYFVRDNGCGFDMTYSDKLFNAFQRLHSEKEFPGTGIGLATVRRIINRHRGRVWAESVVNQGATFYFSLPGIKNQS